MKPSKILSQIPLLLGVLKQSTAALSAGECLINNSNTTVSCSCAECLRNRCKNYQQCLSKSNGTSVECWEKSRNGSSGSCLQIDDSCSEENLRNVNCDVLLLPNSTNSSVSDSSNGLMMKIFIPIGIITFFVIISGVWWKIWKGRKPLPLKWCISCRAERNCSRGCRRSCEHSCSGAGCGRTLVSIVPSQNNIEPSLSINQMVAEAQWKAHRIGQRSGDVEVSRTVVNSDGERRCQVLVYNTENGDYRFREI